MVFILPHNWSLNVHHCSWHRTIKNKKNTAIVNVFKHLSKFPSILKHALYSETGFISGSEHGTTKYNELLLKVCRLCLWCGHSWEYSKNQW